MLNSILNLILDPFKQKSASSQFKLYTMPGCITNVKKLSENG